MVLRRSRQPIVIASRKSPLARAQAHAVGQALTELHPGIDIDYFWVESQGDIQIEGSLADSGGKGLFAKAVEQILLSGKAHLAVHSLKDVPSGVAEQTPGLTLAAIPPRGDVRDCLVVAPGISATTLQDLPAGAVIGTSSPRRGAQILRMRPDLKTAIFRGNVQTRLAKVLEQKVCDATLMAVAGLQRAGLGQHAKNTIDASIMLPAACQGALALQCRADDHPTIWRCLPLNDALTSQAVHAERQVVASLHGDCHSPIGVLVEALSDGSSITFRLRAKVLSMDGKRCAEFDDHSSAAQLRRLVKRAIKSLKDQGVHEILA